MLRSLPPAGYPICLAPPEEPERIFQAAFEDRSVFLYGSGTMALAAALVAARESAGEYHGIVSPEVLLPAYACPDLVSAALYAGLAPVLVDLAADTPWMDLDSLRNKLSSNTVAIVAAHFLGIPERIAAIRTALDGSAALIIEDSAQLFPIKPSEDVWQGDLVTLSFGRGKPVSLLGGGAVLCRSDTLSKHLPLTRQAALQVCTKKPRMLFRSKANIYNAFLSPKIFGLLQSIPFLSLGETIYTPLKSISQFDEGRIGTLAANIEAYRERTRTAQNWLSEMLADMDGAFFSDLSGLNRHHSELVFLRYPLLLRDQALRDKLHAALSLKGLGCSRMYPKPLPEIEGLEDRFQGQGEFPQASKFSQRLLTLPCHSGVRPTDIKAIRQVILEAVRTD